MIIDAQSHGFHGGSLDKLSDVGGKWAKQLVAEQRERARQRPQYLDVALRVKMLNTYGIDMQVVTPSSHIEINYFPGDPQIKLDLSRAMNDNMAKLQEDSKGKLISIGTIPLELFDQGGSQEMERAINSLGLKGINIPSHIGGKALDTPEFESFWAQAEKMDIPIYIHPHNAAGSIDRSYENKYGLSYTFGWPFETTLALSGLVFSGIMERYPKLKVVSHHLGGGMIPFFWGRMVEAYEPAMQPNLIGRTMNRPIYDYFSRFYYDTAVGESVSAVRCAYEIFGADRLVFATDAPFGPENGERRLATYANIIRSLGLPQEDTEKILSGNIRRILKLN